jgi:CO/xanthine dehydrogenase Mo-binding subunit
MDGPAPAILNAVRHALGAAPRCVPATPERVLETMEHAAKGPA